jgi:perosamine synthetase
MKIPLSRPDVTSADVEAVVEVLHTPHLSLGPKVEEFERAFCEYTGAQHATAVNSGTSALHLAIRALGVGAGDEVITSSFSFVASANCALFEQANPVFVDIDPVSFNLDPSLVEAAITERTKAILPVHVFGRPADMDRITRIAAARGLRVIEDACEALGAFWQDRHVGTIGDVGTFAFYPNKQITTGEGGMIVTDDDYIADEARIYRDQGKAGFTANVHTHLGYNWRMSEPHAAIALSQLGRLDAFIGHRQRLAKRYDDGLTGSPLTALSIPAAADCNYYKYVAFLPDGVDRAVFKERLRHDYGVGLSGEVYELPLHRQPVFAPWATQPLPGAEQLCARHVCLPVSATLTDDQAELVVFAVNDVIGRL